MNDLRIGQYVRLHQIRPCAQRSVMPRAQSISSLNKRIIRCKRCPRLAEYVRMVGKTKVKRFADQKYWARALPGFGDANARMLIIGLAPAAHGGNRTGRMFTGDSSGDWLARALYENGLANSPTSVSWHDGLQLKDAYVTAAVKCAPPENKPTRAEFEECAAYLQDELLLLGRISVIVCLGRMAFDSCRRLLDIRGIGFAHGKAFEWKQYTIVCSYHPSRQNTQTGRLSWEEWDRVFKTARNALDACPS